MKKLLLLFCAVIALSSCKSSFYQFYDVASTLPERNAHYTLENDECQVIFNFWNLAGDASFTFRNKTDQNLYIPLAMSSFVFNGMTRSMFIDSDYTEALGKYSSRTVHSQPVVCVAPHSSAVVYDAKIVDRIYLFCENSKDNPKRSYAEDFSEADSPVHFDYYISYSYNFDCKNAETLSASFFVSRIENVKRKLATSQSEYKNCLNYSTRKVDVIEGMSPMRFYQQKIKTKPLPVDFDLF